MKIKVDSGKIGRLLRSLIRRWPGINYGFLSSIGYEGRRALYENFLRGQVIDLKKYPYDIAGKRTVSYGISRNRKSLKISSYPLNLYNPRQVYGAARSVVESRIKSELKNIEEKILVTILAKIDRAVSI
jgi:hypothetical protein